MLPSSGSKRPPREDAIGACPYEISASRMVGTLASELVVLLADSVQLGGQIFPKVTGVQG